MANLTITLDDQDKKDIKLAKKRHYKIEELEEVVFQLANGLPLDEKYHDHALEGNWINHRECHIKSINLDLYDNLQYKY